MTLPTKAACASVQPQNASSNLRQLGLDLEHLAQKSGGDLPVHLRELLMDYAKVAFDADDEARALAQVRYADPDPAASPSIALTNVHKITYDEKTKNLVLELHADGERRWRGMTVPSNEELANLLGTDIASAVLSAGGGTSGFQHELVDVQARLSHVVESVFQFTVLHDRPIDDSPSLKDLAYEIDEGAFVGGDVKRLSLRKLSQGQLAVEAVRLGSDETWFMSGDEMADARISSLCDAAFEAHQSGLPHANPANISTEYDAYRAYEMGWYQGLSEDEFLALMAEETNLELAHAQGQELDWHPLRRQVIDDIIEAGGWALDMDTGRPKQKGVDVERPRG